MSGPDRKGGSWNLAVGPIRPLDPGHHADILAQALDRQFELLSRDRHSLRAHARYAWYVARHKYFVFRAGCRVGAPLWALLIHDYSKLSRAEWTPYVAQFYGHKDEHPTPEHSELLKARGMAFNYAWLHHQHANPHHWQHWMLREDSGQLLVLPMPERYWREMVADWMGAGRAITGKWEVAEWYFKNRETILLDPVTRRCVEALINEVTAGHLTELYAMSREALRQATTMTSKPTSPGSIFNEQ